MKNILFCLIIFFLFTFSACDDSLTGTNAIPTDPTSHIPFIEAVSANPQEICKNEESLIKCIASDTANDIQGYIWEVTSGNIKNIGGYQVVYMPGDPGIGLVTCQVTDRAGNSSNKSSAAIKVDNCYASNPRIAHKDIFGNWSIE